MMLTEVEHRILFPVLLRPEGLLIRDGEFSTTSVDCCCIFVSSGIDVLVLLDINDAGGGGVTVTVTAVFVNTGTTAATTKVLPDVIPVAMESGASVHLPLS